MNAYNLICGAVNVTSGRFSDYWDFAEWIGQRYGHLPYDQEIVLPYLQDDIRKLTKHDNVVLDQYRARDLLLVHDLELAATKLEKIPSANDFTRNLDNAYRVIIQALHDLGLEFSDPPFFVVDQFPEPYNNMDWVAFAPDKADQEDFGIESGVYLLKSELAPYHSELTLAHELIHVIIGSSNPYLLGRGLEEGLADLVGTLYIGMHLYPCDIVRNVFIHTRLGSNLTQSIKLYLDYTRQAFAIYRNFGLKGLTQLMQGGRDAVKDAEKHSLSGSINALSLESGDWNDEFTQLAETVLLRFVPNLVVSPLAMYIGDFVKVNSTVEEIAEATHLDPLVVEQVLEELQTSTFTILLDKNRVAYSDLPLVTQANALRYNIAYGD